MTEISTTLMGLLGKSEDDSEFKLLLQDLGEPTFVHLVGTMRYYGFLTFGLVLTCRGIEEPYIFAKFTLKFHTKDIESGSAQTFNGRLPANIERSDGPDIVESKFGFKPYRRSESDEFVSVSFVVRPYDYDFRFRPADRLAMMTVSWTETDPRVWE